MIKRLQDRDIITSIKLQHLSTYQGTASPLYQLEIKSRLNHDLFPSILFSSFQRDTYQFLILCIMPFEMKAFMNEVAQYNQIATYFSLS